MHCCPEGKVDLEAARRLFRERNFFDVASTPAEYFSSRREDEIKLDRDIFVIKWKVLITVSEIINYYDG